MIIAIGLRTKSSTATAFRVWANNILQQYMVKGFAIDDKRLEDPTKFGRDYFDELKGSPNKRASLWRPGM